MAQNGNMFYREYGPWKPFPFPIDYPLNNPTDEPWLALKFHESWRPYVVGALSALARPETYAEYGTGFIKEDIDWGGQLPWLIEPWPVPKFYNWHFIQDPSESGDSPSPVVQGHVAPGIDGFYGTTFMVTNLCTDCENSHQITAVGYPAQSPFSYPVGGRVSSLFGFLLHTVVGNAWSVSHTDCLDNTVVDTFGGNSFEILDFDCKAFQVIALGAFYVTAIITQDYQCAPA